MDNKVSIITPVYNGEKYIARYLESVLNQSYKNIELIIIDDGSTDKTKEIIDKYIVNFPQRKIKYIHQENGGQASAVANGIKYVTGKYLVGADSDDYFELDAIEKMVNFFNNNSEASIIRGNAIARDENTGKELYKMKVLNKYKNTDNFFEDLIYIRGINCFSGVYMLDFEKYKFNNPNLLFYTGKEGQNWQLLLPAAYKGKCLYLDEYVYNYMVRSDSHSHINRTIEQNEKRQEGLSNILKNTLNILEIDEKYKKYLFDEIDYMQDKNLYLIYCKSHQKDKVKEYFKRLKKKRIKDVIAYFVGTNKIINNIYVLLKR